MSLSRHMRKIKRWRWARTRGQLKEALQHLYKQVPTDSVNCACGGAQSCAKCPLVVKYKTELGDVSLCWIINADSWLSSSITKNGLYQGRMTVKHLLDEHTRKGRM